MNSLEDDSFEQDGFEEDSFGDDAFEEASVDDGSVEDSLDDMSADGFAEDLGDAFEGDAAGDEFEDEGDDAIEEAFARAMDAEDDDEFVRRLSERFRRAARVARRCCDASAAVRCRSAAAAASGSETLGNVAGRSFGGALGRASVPIPAGAAPGPNQTRCHGCARRDCGGRSHQRRPSRRVPAGVAGIAGRYACAT